jgi:asparagine synthetase B (glutamine-hydrolysing)
MKNIMERFNNEDLNEFYTYTFDFNNQYKTLYVDWLKAFTDSIAKRAKDDCFIGMSSGYDSGAMAHELSHLKYKFKIYTIINNENADIIAKRHKILAKNKLISSVIMDKMPMEDYLRVYDFLKDKINPIALRDPASPAVAFMFESAAKEGRTICLCSQGGDETISDYALFPKQSTFKGVFPKKLFEWNNFRHGMQEEYINEIEEIAALYGIECRYPYLDVNLIQEYLWLAPELKNAHYKAPLREYLISNNFPFDEGVKKGFKPNDVCYHHIKDGYLNLEV